MSEEVLKALMQLFAIISKQDEGLTKGEREYVQNFLKQQLASEDVVEYLSLFDQFSSDNAKKPIQEEGRKRTSVIDSVRILGICKRINKKLTQEQKVIVLVRLFELANQDRKFTTNRMAIINTASEVFNISKSEHKSIEDFVVIEDSAEFDDSQMLVVGQDDLSEGKTKFIHSELDDGFLVILKVASVNLYFLQYSGIRYLPERTGFNKSKNLPFCKWRNIETSKGTTCSLQRCCGMFYARLLRSQTII